MKKFREAIHLIAVVVIKKYCLEDSCSHFKTGQERESQQPGDSPLVPRC